MSTSFILVAETERSSSPQREPSAWANVPGDLKVKRPHLDIDRFVEVLVFFDQSLHAVQRVSFVLSIQEGLPGSHPVFSLLTVPMKQLKKREAGGKMGVWPRNSPSESLRQTGGDAPRTHLQFEALIQHHPALSPGLLQTRALPI